MTEEGTSVGRGALEPASSLDGASDLDRAWLFPQSASAGTPRRRRALTRKQVYPSMIDGRPVPDTALGRLGRRAQQLFTSERERQEAELERLLRARPSLTRPNVIAVCSPKGGVGKTTCTYLAGGLLASRPRLRVLAIDTNPDWGTLGKLAPDSSRSERSLAEVLAAMDRIHSAAELFPYVSPAPTGLHLLAAPPHPEAMERMTPRLYGQLIAFLSRFYDAILLDLGTGLTKPIARFALQRADQGVLIASPEWMTASIVLDAVDYVQEQLGAARLALVLNQAPKRERGNRSVLEAEFRRRRISRHVSIPYDERLRTMLDSGTYTLERLDRPTRVAIKRLGLATAQSLV